jgi:hypothetical protein
MILPRDRILGRNWKQKIKAFSSLLFTVTSTNRFYSPHSLSKSGWKLFYNLNLVCGNFKIMPRILYKLHIHEFGFRSERWMKEYALDCRLARNRRKSLSACTH